MLIKVLLGFESRPVWLWSPVVRADTKEDREMSQTACPLSRSLQCRMEVKIDRCVAVIKIQGEGSWFRGGGLPTWAGLVGEFQEGFLLGKQHLKWACRIRIYRSLGFPESRLRQWFRRRSILASAPGVPTCRREGEKQESAIGEVGLWCSRNKGLNRDLPATTKTITPIQGKYRQDKKMFDMHRINKKLIFRI